MRILIGNLISLPAAGFTLGSSLSGDFKRIYLYQAVQCFLLALSNVFFSSVSGAVILLVCGIRNVLAAYRKLDVKTGLVFLVLAAVLGIVSNNRGFIGLIPVAVTLVYTIGCVVCKKTEAVKINTIINLAGWAVYDLCIIDLVSAVVDTGSAAAAVISLYHILRKKKQNPAE